jgi:hypothetical protein
MSHQPRNQQVVPNHPVPVSLPNRHDDPQRDRSRNDRLQGTESISIFVLEAHNPLPFYGPLRRSQQMTDDRPTRESVGALRMIGEAPPERAVGRGCSYRPEQHWLGCSMADSEHARLDPISRENAEWSIPHRTGTSLRQKAHGERDSACGGHCFSAIN